MTDLSADIPAELRAGDTAKWQRSFSDYPASAGWVLAYTIAGTGGVFTASATANGDAFEVTISAATTDAWPAGRYQITEYVSKDGERFTLNTQPLRVLANLVGASPGDTRSHAQKMLDAIEAWLESKAPTAASVEIAGRKISNYPLADLLALRSKYKFEVSQETGLATGKRGSKLLVRFS
jgi:hypothetical protein